jgi:hypothetical protein
VEMNGSSIYAVDGVRTYGDGKIKFAYSMFK